MSHANLDRDAIDSVAILAQQAATPDQLDPGMIYAQARGDGSVQIIDLTDPKYLDAPRRKTGTYGVADVDGFVHYWMKHSDLDSEIYAYRDTDQIVGVLNAHESDAARFEDHKVRLRLELSDQFKAWQAIDGRLLPQEQFAEFIDDWAHTILEPEAATVLELVQTFHASSRVEYKSGKILASGERQLTYTEQTAASGGRNGQLEIPAKFTLALPVFQRAEVADRIEAKLRYRINNGDLLLGVKLQLLTEVTDAAFTAVVDHLQNQITTHTVVYAS